MKQQGFTLIELMIALGVLAIIAGLVIATLDPFSQVQKSNDTRRKSDLSQIQKVLEQYYQDNNQYPPSTTDGTFEIMYQGNALQWGKGPWGPYMDVLPKDPDANRYYVYYSPKPYQSYFLYASLERGGNDPQACQYTNSYCRKGPYSIYCICSNVPQSNSSPINCGTTSASNNGYCNFGITSPNVSP